MQPPTFRPWSTVPDASSSIGAHVISVALPKMQLAQVGFVTEAFHSEYFALPFALTNATKASNSAWVHEPTFLVGSFQGRRLALIGVGHVAPAPGSGGSPPASPAGHVTGTTVPEDPLRLLLPEASWPASADASLADPLLAPASPRPAGGSADAVVQALNTTHPSDERHRREPELQLPHASHDTAQRRPARWTCWPPPKVS
jgi:hypothetical protein